MASIQGWGRETWNSGAWNQQAPVEASGNGLTSTVGTVSLVTTNIFGVTGNQLTSSIGDATQASEYAATGNAATSSLGTMPNPTIVDNQLLTGWNRGVGTTVPLGWNAASWNNGDFILTTSNGLSGAGLTASLGEESPVISVNITATGLGTTLSTGTATAIGNQITTPSGNAITSSLGTETVTENATACSTTVPVTIIDNDGDEALSLANGSNIGQLKIFISSTANTVTLTPATTAGAYSTIATTNIGETYGLMWTADGWAVIMRSSGDTQADNAVDDLPVLA